MVASSSPLAKLYNLTAALREVDPDMAVATFHIFSLIALKPGISSQDVLKETGMTQASVSRHLAILSGMTTLRKRGGYDFIDMVEDMNDRRNKVAFLTTEGKAFAARAMALISSEGIEGLNDQPTADEYRKKAKATRR